MSDEVTPEVEPDADVPAPVKGMVSKGDEGEWMWATFDAEGTVMDSQTGFADHKMARDDITTKYAEVAIPVEVDMPPEPQPEEAAPAEAPAEEAPAAEGTEAVVEAPPAEASGAPDA